MRLTKKTRSAIPTKDFAGPSRSYPIENKGHAEAALSDVSKFGSPQVKAEVRSKVARKFPGMDDHNPPTNHDEFHKLGR